MIDGKPDQPEEPLQLERAEYQEPSRSTTTCVACQRPIAGSYFTINGKITCGSCKVSVERFRRGDGGGRFLRAFLFGIGGAIAGGLLYYVVSAIFHAHFGLVAIVVGLLVGGAVRKGTGGRGGVGYQILAVLLTYCAVVSDTVPQLREAILELKQKHASEAAAPSVTNAPAPAAAPAAPVTPPAQDDVKPGAAGIALGYVLLFLFALVLPFMGGTSVLGWVIIAIALWEAWKLNKKPAFVILGPYSMSGAAGGA